MDESVTERVCITASRLNDRFIDFIQDDTKSEYVIPNNLADELYSFLERLSCVEDEFPIIPSDKVFWYDPEFQLMWTTNYYDHPLNGYGYYKGDLMYFDRGYSSEYMTLTALTVIQKIKVHLKRKWFEICIGYNWSYRNGKKYKYSTPWKNPILNRFFHKLYFGSKTKMTWFEKDKNDN